jgi:hypothetical protein
MLVILATGYSNRTESSYTQEATKPHNTAGKDHRGWALTLEYHEFLLHSRVEWL